MSKKDELNENDVVLIFGGDGLVGRYVTKAILRSGAKIRIASRFCKYIHDDLKVYGYPGQIHFINLDITDYDAVEKAVAGSTKVINLVGILKETKQYTFEKVHITGASNIAQACAKHNIKRLIHISALVESSNTTRYATTKMQGEQEVILAFPKAIIIRPSIIVGAEDNFTNLFIKIVRYSPFVPLFGGGKNKLQPIYVDDLAEFIKLMLSESIQKVGGKKFAVAGPKHYSMKEILNIILRTMNRKRILLYVPFWFARRQAAILEMLPGKLLTRDQVELCRYDSIIQSGQKNGMTEFGLSNSAFETVLQKILL